MFILVRIGGLCNVKDGSAAGSHKLSLYRVVKPFLTSLPMLVPASMLRWTTQTACFAWSFAAIKVKIER